MIARYQFNLIFRSEKNGAWQRIARIKHEEGKVSFSYTDTTARPLISYSYASETIDEDSLHSSRSNPVPVTIKTLPEQAPIAGLTAAYDNKTKRLRVKSRPFEFVALYLQKASIPQIHSG